jgi:hypothetical protein
MGAVIQGDLGLDPGPFGGLSWYLSMLQER